MKYAKITVLLVAISFFVFACTQSNTPNTETAQNSSNISSPETSTPEAAPEIASGEKIYSEYCVKCHKDDGTGGKVKIEGKTIKAANFTSAGARKDSDEEFIEHIRDGVIDEGMPSFKDQLNDQQIKEVVKYIRSDIQK